MHLKCRVVLGAALGVTIVIGPSAALAQGTAAGTLVAWRPAVPVQGSLVVLGVQARASDSIRGVSGELAGEGLHFELIDGWYRAVGAVPLSSRGRVRAQVVLERAGGRRDTLTRSLAVGTRRAPNVRLRVDPDFVQPPESLASRLQAERDLVREIKRRAHDRSRLWDGPFQPPRPGPLGSVFGEGRVFNGRLRSRHLGADFSGALGDSVRATNRGVVVHASGLYFSGTTVFVDHGAGLLTGYLHLSLVLVAPGDTVATGQVIGLVGATGRVTGPHLHWFASYGEITIDPMALLGVDLEGPLTPH